MESEECKQDAMIISPSHFCRHNLALACRAQKDFVLTTCWRLVDILVHFLCACTACRQSSREIIALFILRLLLLLWQFQIKNRFFLIALCLLCVSSIWVVKILLDFFMPTAACHYRNWINKSIISEWNCLLWAFGNFLIVIVAQNGALSTSPMGVVVEF